jgi:hypothetical protein
MKHDNEEEVSKSLLFDHTDRKEKVLFKFKAITDPGNIMYSNDY